MELPNSDIKKFFIFSQKKAFLIFWEMETPKKLPYISGNRNFLILPETETLKNFIYFLN